MSQVTPIPISGGNALAGVTSNAPKGDTIYHVSSHNSYTPKGHNSEQAVYNFSRDYSFSPIFQNLSFSSQLDKTHSRLIRKPTDQTPGVQHPSHDSKIFTSSSVLMHIGHSTPKHASSFWQAADQSYHYMQADYQQYESDISSNEQADSNDKQYHVL